MSGDQPLDGRSGRLTPWHCLAWTVIRPGGLFDRNEVSDYQVGTERLPGRYTARVDLAHESLRQAVDDGHVHTFIDVRTTRDTPSFLDLIRNEAFSGKRDSGNGRVRG
ncbi:hypothetical protein AB5J52_01330 [Streptomyces sp. R39]|uniref:NAD(P)-binding domain-containing protein n=1 Tax=Streptomyces sp. R39 TaxID=3238631 RepID=A0AB39QFI6_9ACTN